MNYPKPSTDLQHVLLTAIKKGYVDCFLVPYPGFRMLNAWQNLKGNIKTNRTAYIYGQQNASGGVHAL